jgi:hypothetical protein
MSKFKLSTQAEVEKVFREKVRPKLASIEKERLKVRKIQHISMGVIATVVLAMCIYSPFLSLLFLGLGVSLGKGVWSSLNSKSKEFVTQFRKVAIKTLFETMIPGCTYSPFKYVSKNSFLHSKILEGYRFEKFTGEDYVSGKFGELNFEFSEVKALNKSDDTKEYYSVFSGLFFAVTLRKSLNLKMLIMPDDEVTFGKMLRDGQKAMAPESYSLIQLESKDFEDHFCVYADDQIKARVLLSPMVMEKMSKLHKESGLKMIISLLDDKLYVAIESDENFFHPKDHGKIFSNADVLEMYDLISLPLQIQECLELDEYIEKKVA